MHGRAVPKAMDFNIEIPRPSVRCNFLGVVAQTLSQAIQIKPLPLPVPQNWTVSPDC